MKFMEILTNSNQQEEIKVSDESTFDWKLSPKSISLDQITGVIFGGFSSRFWSFRK